jgi:hypothetical protein
MSLFKRIFIIFSNIIIVHYIKKPLVEEITFLISYCVMLQYICSKIVLVSCIEKQKYTFKKKFKWFKTFVIPHNLNNVCEPCEEFENFISEKGLKKKERHDKYVINKNLTNNHIHIEDDKHS